MINDILNKYLNNEKKVNISNYALDSIISLLSHLKNPQKNFKSLHIAGTNGKGSTAFMIASILQRSGYKTGLYISPHLHIINERIKINSIDIDEETLYRYISEIDQHSGALFARNAYNPEFGTRTAFSRRCVLKTEPSINWTNICCVCSVPPAPSNLPCQSALPNWTT